jgi:tungstate transport system substrate-binding protein
MKKLFAVALLVLLAAPPANAFERLVLASTTSTQNSGLFERLLPAFEKRTGIKVSVIAVGTGQALAMAKRGDADVVLVHDPAAEEKFVAEGWGCERRLVMYNDFVVVGPSSDPAGVKGQNAVAAFKRLAAKGFPFVSRGDDSGTHRRERELWQRAGAAPKGPGYLEVGQGMEQTLRVAGEKQLYTLSDRGTWLATKDRDRFGLAVLVEGDPLLFNQYGVIAVNPARFPHVRAKEARAFVDWITSPEGQAVIGGFRDAHGNQLFIPNASPNAAPKTAKPEGTAR